MLKVTDDPPGDVVDQLRAAGCVFAEDEARLLVDAADDAAHLGAMVARRASGVPLEQVLGWAIFCGLRIAVDPDVFVPRRRSELLARQAVELAPREGVVVDLCCGSGALGVVVLTEVDGVALHAADIDAAAVRCAGRNLAAAAPNGRHRAYVGDLFTALPVDLLGTVDLLVASAPYVPTDEVPLLPPEARLYEPMTALDGGGDGLDVVRRIIDGAGPWLAPTGVLLVETSERQASSAVQRLSRAGFTPRIVHSDDLDATVLIGTRV